MQFYVLTHSLGRSGFPFFRIRVDEPARKLMEETISEQASGLLHPEAERIPYDPGFQAERGVHLFEIQSFPVPDHIESVLKGPDMFEDFTQDLLEKNEARAIVSVDFGNPKPPVVYFQAFDRRYSLASKRWVFMDEKTFRPLERQGITLSTNVDAVLEDGNLYFVSPAMVRRVLDFSVAFEPATDERLAEFAQHENFLCEEDTDLPTIADNIVRKRVSQLLNRKILDQINVSEIVSVASQFNVAISTKMRDGREKVVVPSDRAELKELLKLLEEKFYISSLTYRPMEASGNRYL
jgi:hypothetical protein